MYHIQHCFFIILNKAYKLGQKIVATEALNIIINIIGPSPDVF